MVMVMAVTTVIRAKYFLEYYNYQKNKMHMVYMNVTSIMK